MPKKKNFSAWLGIPSDSPAAKFLQHAAEPAESPMLEMPPEQRKAEMAAWARGETVRKPAPRDMTLTGDMAASSPFQQRAAAQFDQNMRAASQPVELTPEEEAKQAEIYRAKIWMDRYKAGQN